MLAEIHSKDFSTKELNKIKEVVNHQGFDLIVQFLKEQSFIKLADSVNDLPESPDQDGIIKSVISSNREGKAFRNAFEVLRKIQNNEIELTKTEVKL